MGVCAELIVRGQAVELTDPAGSTFTPAGDFACLLPVSAKFFPVLVRVDPYGGCDSPQQRYGGPGG